jgi:hypothetical protein
MSARDELTEGGVDWQVALPFADLNGAVAVAIVAGSHHTCTLLV